MIQCLCAKAYLSRIQVINRENIPKKTQGPVVFVSLHRNGAVDGFVIRCLAQDITFLITRNLLRNKFLRLLFNGIEVLRDRDSGNRRQRFECNNAAIDHCLDLLNLGGKLVIFPEGTSSLGPKHLPFQGGAARILFRFLETYPEQPITVVPLGLHYERAWAFRSRAHILVGESFPVDLPHNLSDRDALNYVGDSLQSSLEKVGANFSSSKDQERAEAIAYASTLGTNFSYAQSLTWISRNPSSQLASRWDAFDELASQECLWRHQHVPLVPLRKSYLVAYCLWFLILAPLVLAATLLNALPIALTGALTKRFADDQNVIALTRIIVGLPTFVLWAATVGLAGAISGQLWLLGVHLAISLLGFLAYYRFKKLAVVIHNGFRATPQLYELARRLHHSIIQTIYYEHNPT